MSVKPLGDANEGTSGALESIVSTNTISAFITVDHAEGSELGRVQAPGLGGWYGPDPRAQSLVGSRPRD